MPTIYYSSRTEREGSWQKSDGYVLSDNETILQAKINSMPKFDAFYSWEYDAIKSFETTEEKHQLFLARSKEEILWVGDFELDKYR